MISQKCQYAVRAVFELAKRFGEGTVKVGELAEAQGIPQRFLETILLQLKQGGFVDSRRGKEGGYMLIKRPEELTVGEIIGYMEGDLAPVNCASREGQKCSRNSSQCVFQGVWERARKAVSDVYEGTTFLDLLVEEAAMESGGSSSYVI